MDRRTGDIIDAEAYDALKKEKPEVAQQFFAPVRTPLTPYQRETKKIGRNDPCVCGSGKKFKKCCYLKPEEEADEQADKKPGE